MKKYIILLTIILQFNPAYSWSLDERQAFKDFEQGQFDKVKTYWQKRQIETPYDGHVNYNLGQAEYKLGDPSKAAKSFERVVEKSTDASKKLKEKAYFNWGNTLYKNATNALGDKWESQEVAPAVLDKAIADVSGAIQKYTNTIVLNKQNKEAPVNKKEAEELLKKLQQKKQQQEQKQQNDEKNKQDKQNKENKDNKDNKNKDSKGQNQKNKDNKGQGNKDQDKQQKDKGQQNKDQNKDQGKEQKDQQDKQQGKQGDKDSSQEKQQGKDQQQDKQQGDKDEQQDKQSEQQKDKQGQGDQQSEEKEEKQGKQQGAGDREEEKRQQEKETGGLGEEKGAKEEKEGKGAAAKKGEKQPQNMLQRSMRVLLDNLQADESKLQKQIIARKTKGQRPRMEQGQNPW